MSSLRKDFAIRLQELRQQKELTQEELADLADLSVGFIRAIEQSKHAPSFESLEALAEALRVKVKDLFDF